MDEELKQVLNIDYIELLYEDDSVSIVEMLVMHEGLNRNKCDIPHDVIVKALASLANKPIWAIPNKKYLKNYSDDFIEHARNSDQEKDIMIFGVFPESGVNNAQFVSKNNKIYLKVQAILFKKYAPIAMNILKNRDGNCKISVEILAKGDTKDGILYVNEMHFLSATCLGADIAEGIEGSSMDIVRFSLEEAIDESNKKYLNFSKDEVYTIPDKVKDNTKQGLDLRKEFGRGGTNIGVNMAKYLTSNENATLEKIKKINQYFTKHSEDDISNENPPSNTYISYLLWGGEAGLEWAKDVVENKNNKNNDSIVSNPDEGKGTLNNITQNSINPDVIIENKNNEEVEHMDENKKIEFSLNSTQIFDIFNNAVAGMTYKNGDWDCCKYWTEAYDESFVYLRDCEDGKAYKMPYVLNDNAATINFDEKVEVISGGYLEVGQSSETIANSEEVQVDNKEQEKVIDNSAEVEELKNKYTEMETKYADMESKLKNAEAELEEFKAKKQKDEEEAKMMALLEEFSHTMTDDEKKEMKNKMADTKFADFEQLVNAKIKAFALKAKEDKEETKDNEEEIKNSVEVSFSSFGLNDHYDFHNKNNSDVSIAEKYGVKI